MPFYLGEEPHIEGRTIQQIWAWDFEELECVNNYIQWLFPLPEKSHFNPYVPIIDERVIEVFKNNSLLKQNLLRLRS